MKKQISLILLLVLLLSLCACGKTVEPDQTAMWKDDTVGSGFRVGFARVDITNRLPIPMSGYGNTTARVSTSIESRLYANCVAVTTEDEQTVFLVQVDYQRAYGSKLEQVEKWLEERLGIPGTHLIVTATHTHAAGDFNQKNIQAVDETVEIFRQGIYEACVQALADRKPAEMYIGSIETEGLNFVKHYQHVDSEGNTLYFGDNFGTRVIDSTTKHTTEADPTMYVMQFKREGGKDIIMASWRVHATLGTKAASKAISSSYPGKFQEAMEAMYDCHFAYYQGFAGNINPHTSIASEQRTTDLVEYGMILAEYALSCIQSNMKKVETCGLSLKQDTLDMPVNHSTDNLLMTAKSITAVWTSTNDSKAAMLLGKDQGIRSVYHANAIITRSAMGKTTPVEVTVLSFSPEFAIATCIGEPFDSLGHYLEEKSPYETTVTFGYTNGEAGYMPSAYGWEYTSYESDVSYLMPGSGEEVMDHIAQMLVTMKNGQ